MRYQVRDRKPDESQTDKRGFKTKRDARFFLSTIDVAKPKGLYIGPTEGKLSISCFAALWKAGRINTLHGDRVLARRAHRRQQERRSESARQADLIRFLA